MKNIADLKFRSFIRYAVGLAGIAAKVLSLILFSALTMLILLHAGKLIWSMYTATPVGQKFCELFPERAMAIADIVYADLFFLSGELGIFSVVTCLVIGAVLQLTGLYRILYLSRGKFGRIIFIIAPLWAAIAWQFQHSYGYENYKSAWILSLIPTLCVHGRCLSYAAELVPEIADGFTGAADTIRAAPGMVSKFFKLCDEKLSRPGN